MIGLANLLPDWVVSHGQELDARVSLGSYFRLLAYEVIRNDVDFVVYMDLDSVVMSNLNDISSYYNSSTLYQWSKEWPCAGFMIYNLERMKDNFFSLLEKLSFKGGSDQTLLQAVADAHPDLIGTLPRHWDIHMGHGWRANPHELYEADAVSMLHFNGRFPKYFGLGDDETSLYLYCKRTKNCQGSERTRRLYEKSWGLADYYIRINWKWVRHFGRSLVPRNSGGHALVIRDELIS